MTCQAALAPTIRPTGSSNRTVKTLLRDLLYTIRGLAAARVFTATAVLTLALGIGGTTAIFTLIDAVMLRSLPVGAVRFVSGRIEHYNNAVQMTHPDYIVAPEKRDDLPMLEPVDFLALYRQELAECSTVVWNGPLGAFEIKPFDAATNAAAQAAARLTRAGALVSVAGGGDTVAALNAAGAAADFTFISTAGGAFLEWMEGKELPGVAALMA